MIAFGYLVSVALGIIIGGCFAAVLLLIFGLAEGKQIDETEYHKQKDNSKK